MKSTHHQPLDRPPTAPAWFRPCLLLILAILALSGPLTATEVSYEMSYRSQHVWRGISLRQFPVFSTSATISHDSGFGANLWLGLDLSDDNSQGGEVQEIDLDFFYGWNSPRWSGQAGYVELIFPGGSVDRTGEAYLKLEARAPLSPRLEVYYNTDLLRDAFALLSLGPRAQLSERWSGSLTGTIGWAGKRYAEFFGATAAGLHHWSAHLDLSRATGPWAVKFRLAYSDNIDPKVLTDQPIHFWSGVYLSFSP